MLAVYEFEGKTKEEAIRSACEELGVSEEKLRIEVLSYGSTGIFGLVGAKKAQVRVTLRDAPEVKRDAPKAKPDVTEALGDEEASDAEEDIEAVAETARRTLEQVISYVVDDATVAVAKHPDSIRLKIEASNPAILIGRHGRTLDALQYLIRKIVRKKHNTKMRISFDVEGYRDRRKESLTQLALRLGEKVKVSGKPATISPMNAYDRRIVHIALKDDTLVRTQSKGGGEFRKLVIFPQKKQQRG
ncbi:MAG: protein jag [Deltaproteobacteria bacterium]|nr:protein jag [Deltaproteobacteria bacterium]